MPTVATGDGVVVAVVDSGVLGTHVDLATPLSGRAAPGADGHDLPHPRP